MKQLLSTEGMRQTRAAWVLLVLAIAAAAAIVAGSHWYLERDRRASASAGQRLQEARARLEAARRERESLRESSQVFRTLVDRGLLQPERRLEMVEMVDRLRERHGLLALDYEIAPQRALQMPGGRAFAAVDVLASRVKIKARALHEGDLVGFIEALGTAPQGFYPVDRCALRRVEGGVPAEGLGARVEAECAFEWITLKEKNAGRPG